MILFLWIKTSSTFFFQSTKKVYKLINDKYDKYLFNILYLFYCINLGLLCRFCNLLLDKYNSFP